jgi:hypothetical protein
MIVEYIIQGRNARKGLWFQAYKDSFKTENECMHYLRKHMLKTPDHAYYRVIQVISETTVLTVFNTFK